MEERREEWDELKLNGRWDSPLSDLIPNAIAIGTKKMLFIININRNEPVSVVAPEDFGGERDSDDPLVLVYDGSHYEHLIPPTTNDERKIRDLVIVHRGVS